MIKLRTPKFLCIAILVWVFVTASTLSNANEAPRLSAGIIGLGMMSGDELEWSEPDFNSGSWPLSQAVAGSGFNRVLIPESIAWLRTRPFNLPEAFQNQPVALHVISGASFEVYWNGRLIGRSGQPATSLPLEDAGISDSRHYIPPKYILREGNVLAIRYSAHGYKRFHLPLAFSFNITAYENEKYQRLVMYVPAFLLMGGIGAAALLFAALFIRRTSDRGSLWLAMMFLMVVLQSASETSRALMSLSYVGQIARIGITFLAAYGSGLFLNLYLLNYLGATRLKRSALIVTHFFTIVAIANYYSHFDKLTFAVLAIFVAFAIGLAARGVQLKKRYGLPILIALIVFAASFLVGYTRFLDSYYYGAMVLLAGTLFVVQASVFRATERQFDETKLTVNRLELDLLKRQIQPHFIMNTLTALSEWIRTSPNQSVDMIEALSEEFRILNSFVNKTLVPLKDELALCRAHLKLMSFRQDQNFSLETQLESDGIAVPPAIIHTLIENALTHNRYSEDNCEFRFSQIQLDNGTVQLVLTTPPGTSGHKTESKSNTGGLGLAYVRARLEESWGTNFSFSDGRHESGGWQSVIVIPRHCTAGSLA